MVAVVVRDAAACGCERNAIVRRNDHDLRNVNLNQRKFSIVGQTGTLNHLQKVYTTEGTQRDNSTCLHIIGSRRRRRPHPLLRSRVAAEGVVYGIPVVQ